jgi:hypothetical protein
MKRVFGAAIALASVAIGELSLLQLWYLPRNDAELAIGCFVGVIVSICFVVKGAEMFRGVNARPWPPSI